MAKTLRRCRTRECRVSIEGTHFNRVQCEACQLRLFRKPKGTMTLSQISQAKMLVGTMPREKIAKKLGVSLSNLKRSLPGIRLGYFNKYVANPKLVEDVCRYYEKHGKVLTQKKFPQANVRSVVERYKHYSPRQIRWTDEQIIEAARMAGLITFKAQAIYFNRPRANEGAMTSLWMKKFKHRCSTANGLSWWLAKKYVRPSCKTVETKFWQQRDTSKVATKTHRVVLWVDLRRSLNANAPSWLKEISGTMANYQQWLWQTKHVRARVLKMIKEREL